MRSVQPAYTVARLRAASRRRRKTVRRRADDANRESDVFRRLFSEPYGDAISGYLRRPRDSSGIKCVRGAAAGVDGAVAPHEPQLPQEPSLLFRPRSDRKPWRRTNAALKPIAAITRRCCIQCVIPTNSRLAGASRSFDRYERCDGNRFFRSQQRRDHLVTFKDLM